MDVKPSNFIVSLVSLLGIVLPGSIVTFLGLTGPLHSHLPTALLAFQPDTVAAWVIFTITSYIVGQALYGFGSWFLDSLYDRTYRRYKQYLKGDPKNYVRSLVKAHFRNRPQPSTYSWARAYVVTKSPGSVNELEQIEADFKFFRSLALVFLVAPFESLLLPSPLWTWILVSGVAVIVVGSLSKTIVDVRRRRARLQRLRQRSGELTRTQQPLTQADPSRSDHALDTSAATTALGVAVVLVEGAALVSKAAGAVGAIAFLAGFAVVFLRFCQQRWQRNETTYEYAATIGATELPPVPSAEPEREISLSSSEGDEE